jgi:acyl CoA:acetate/3-ketoacid CoA transferase beta subunit
MQTVSLEQAVAMTLRETAPDVSTADVLAAIEAQLTIPQQVPQMDP